MAAKEQVQDAIQIVRRVERVAGFSGADSIDLFDELGGRRSSLPIELDLRPVVQRPSVDAVPTEKV